MTNGEKIVTDVGAAAALTSPYWLPTLQEVSQIAALLLPIFGALWLIIQIGHYVWRNVKSRNASDR